MGVNPIPEGYHTVTPYLVVEGAAERARLREAGVRRRGEASAWTTPNGTIGHAEVKIGDSIVMVGRRRR